MNIRSISTRTILATATAGALVIGSAAGAAAAKGKPETPAQPRTAVTLTSIGIKGHAPIDLATVKPGASITLRASVRDASRTVDPSQTVDMTLGIYTKKVRGTMVAGTTSAPVRLALKPAAAHKKSKHYAGDAVLASVWTSDQLATLKGVVKPGDKVYACISTADLTGVEEKRSTIVKKRLTTVRDCVKVVDSTPVS